MRFLFIGTAVYVSDKSVYADVPCKAGIVYPQHITLIRYIFLNNGTVKLSRGNYQHIFFFAISLANYSFIQPMILVTLFVIGLIRKEKRSTLNMIGSVICVVGMAIFQLI